MSESVEGIVNPTERELQELFDDHEVLEPARRQAVYFLGVLGRRPGSRAVVTEAKNAALYSALVERGVGRQAVRVRKDMIR